MRLLITIVAILLLLPGCSPWIFSKPVPTTMPGGGNLPAEAGRVTNADRPVAQLKEDQPDLMSGLSVKIPDADSMAVEGIVFSVSGTVIYTGTTGSLRIDTLIEAHPVVDLSLFGEKIVLAEGEAFIKTGLSGAMPNRIVMARDGVIVVVSGTMPRAKLTQLARLVVVQR